MATLGIDARAASEVPAGRGRFVRELLLALGRRESDHRYVLHARRRWDADLDERFAWTLTGAPDPAWHIATAAQARGADAFLSTNSYLTAWFLPVPSVVYVHDLIAWVPGAAAQRRAAAIERATIRPAIWRTAALVCNSQATRRDLVQRFPPAAPKTSVVELAAAPPQDLTPERRGALLEELGVEPGFVLSVGTVEPRKNLRRLIEAHQSLPAALRRAHPLVIVGPEGWQRREALAEVAPPAEVRFLGRRSDEELSALYDACVAFAYCSLYEGFGLPLLEAMAHGAACLSSNVSALPEVGGDAVLYADPRAVASMTAGLRRLLEEPGLCERLGAAARARAGGYSWDRTAGELETALLEVAA